MVASPVLSSVRSRDSSSVKCCVRCAGIECSNCICNFRFYGQRQLKHKSHLPTLKYMFNCHIDESTDMTIQIDRRWRRWRFQCANTNRFPHSTSTYYSVRAGVCMSTIFARISSGFFESTNYNFSPLFIISFDQGWMSPFVHWIVLLFSSCFLAQVVCTFGNNAKSFFQSAPDAFEMYPLLYCIEAAVSRPDTSVCNERIAARCMPNIHSTRNFYFCFVSFWHTFLIL